MVEVYSICAVCEERQQASERRMGGYVMTPMSRGALARYLRVKLSSNMYMLRNMSV
jgi:hypothetical protein